MPQNQREGISCLHEDLCIESESDFPSKKRVLFPDHLRGEEATEVCEHLARKPVTEAPR